MGKSSGPKQEAISNLKLSKFRKIHQNVHFFSNVITKKTFGLWTTFTILKGLSTPDV